MSEVPAFARAFKRRPLPKRKRFRILQRDEFTCQYCGARAPDVILHVDHRKAVANGGGNDDRNLVTACADCNLGKSDLEQAPWWLRGQREAALSTYVFEQCLMRFKLPRLGQAGFWYEIYNLAHYDDALSLIDLLNRSSTWDEFIGRVFAHFHDPEEERENLARTIANDNGWDVI